MRMHSYHSIVSVKSKMLFELGMPIFYIHYVTLL